MDCKLFNHHNSLSTSVSSSRDYGGVPIHIAMRVPLLQTPTRKEKLWPIGGRPCSWGATSFTKSSHCHRECSTMGVLLVSFKQLKYSAVLVCRQYMKWTHDDGTTGRNCLKEIIPVQAQMCAEIIFTNDNKLFHYTTVIGMISVLDRWLYNCTEHSLWARPRILSRL